MKKRVHEPIEKKSTWIVVHSKGPQRIECSVEDGAIQSAYTLALTGWAVQIITPEGMVIELQRKM